MADAKGVIVAYNGVCPLCGSRDGTVKEVDGRFRVMCRMMGCKAMYRPCPAEGYPKIEDTTDPWSSDLMKDGKCTYGRISPEKLRRKTNEL